MKIKLFLLLMLGLLLNDTTFTYAKSTNMFVGISIHTHKGNWPERVNRSTFSTPAITQEGNIIRIYSDIDL